MTEQRCKTGNVTEKQLVIEPLWHNVDPIQVYGDVPVNQLGTILSEMRNHSQ